MASSDSAVLVDGKSTWITTFYHRGAGKPPRPICGHYCPNWTTGKPHCLVFDATPEVAEFLDYDHLAFRLQRCVEAERGYDARY